MKANRYLLIFCVIIAFTLPVACGGGGSSTDNQTETAVFRVTLTNLTNGQPLSPMAVILHEDGYRAWEAGIASSVALEMLAEGGNATDLIHAADADPGVLATQTGAGVIPPGGKESVELTVALDGSVLLTVATMLVNTNDAFGGISAESIDHLAVGGTVAFMAPAYDAGTEANSESAATVPGPAASGEGFNAVRNDTDIVRIHPGVISSQDGLSESILTGEHRWDNPVLKLVVARIS